MTKGLKTEQEQQLAVSLFTKKIKKLDLKFNAFFEENKLINSLNDLIELKTEIFENYTITELAFETIP